MREILEKKPQMSQMGRKGEKDETCKLERNHGGHEGEAP